MRVPWAESEQGVTHEIVYLNKDSLLPIRRVAVVQGPQGEEVESQVAAIKYERIVKVERNSLPADFFDPSLPSLRQAQGLGGAPTPPLRQADAQLTWEEALAFQGFPLYYLAPTFDGYTLKTTIERRYSGVPGFTLASHIVELVYVPAGQFGLDFGPADILFVQNRPPLPPDTKRGFSEGETVETVPLPEAQALVVVGSQGLTRVEITLGETFITIHARDKETALRAAQALHACSRP